MPILLILLPILKKFWIPITIGLVLLGGIWYTYNAGKKACQDKINQVIAEQQLASQQAIEKILQRGGELCNIVQSHPLEDKQASCLLSNNPMKVKCVK